MKLIYALIVGFLGVGPMLVHAVPISNTDAFTGAGIDSVEGVQGGASFDGSDVDPSFVTFFSNVGTGGVASLVFTTATISLDGVRLFAANDGAGLGFRRAMSGFRFYADTDNDNIFETLLIDQVINHDYNSGQLEDVDLANNELEMALLFGGTITASHWKYEVIQGQSIGAFEGVRVQELDAIAASVPEPTALALMALGLVGLGFTKHRKA